MAKRTRAENKPNRVKVLENLESRKVTKAHLIEMYGKNYIKKLGALMEKFTSDTSNLQTKSGKGLTTDLAIQKFNTIIIQELRNKGVITTPARGRQAKPLAERLLEGWD